MLDFAFWDAMPHHAAGTAIADDYDAHIRLAQQIELLGWHSYFIIEHQNALQGTSAPSVYLAGVARETSSLVVSFEERQRLIVVTAGPPGIVFVDAVFQKLHVLVRRLQLHHISIAGALCGGGDTKGPRAQPRSIPASSLRAHRSASVHRNRCAPHRCTPPTPR